MPEFPLLSNTIIVKQCSKTMEMYDQSLSAFWNVTVVIQ